MKILIGLAHPAHYHLFKNLIRILSKKEYEIIIVISEKDILKKLLDSDGLSYYIIGKSVKKTILFCKILKLIFSTFELNKIINIERPNLLMGCLSQLVFSGFIKRKPVYFFGEDDFSYTYFQCIFILPFVSKIFAPVSSNLGPFKYKKFSYFGYQKLAYLHPNLFSPDESKLNNIIHPNYFLIRLVGLNAYHDKGIKGIDNEIIKRLIDKLSYYGKVYISSERNLPKWLEEYNLKIDVNSIHHILAFSSLFIGDSQSMAVEAAMLGVPSIRFNDFAGKIGILEELEHKYGLTYGINPSEPEKLFNKITELLSIPNLREEFQIRRQKMLADKIDVTAFMVWFIENYPESVKVMKENPDYQFNFK